MVSNPKRMKYASENEFSSSDDDGETSADADYVRQNRKNASRSAQKSNTKWLSKNAIMARENRLKKKLYLTKLENEVGRLKAENDNFTKVIDNQSQLTGELRKQIKYLKSVIANSTDIGNLIRNIHHNTGMSVTTSLDQTLSLNNDYVSKPKQHIARKTAHPWEDKNPILPLQSDFLSPHFDGLNDFHSDALFSNSGIDDILDTSDNFIDPSPPRKEVDSISNEGEHLKEHNYTTEKYIDDVGVCLHVSKHRVSVEFCSTCSDNAYQAWMD